MNANYSLLFYLKKPKNYVNGQPKPIYMRITVEGLPKELSAGRECLPSRWCPKANRASGNKEDVRTLNSYLDTLDRGIEKAHTDLVKEAVVITAETIKNKYLGITAKPHYLMEIFADHNQKMEALIGNGFKKNTLKGYKTSVGHLTAFLQKKLKKTDIDICSIDHGFILGYDFYLRSEMGCDGVSVAKYMKHLRKITNLCLALRWLKDNPFVFYKNKAKAKEREFLTQDELERVINKHFLIPRLAQVRDMFVFSCYTGLAYIDIKQLLKTELCNGVDGNLWIFNSREKTGTTTHIPLMNVAVDLVNRYSDHPKCISSGIVFPVLSNQKMNSYLKEIADLCGITKELTFHMARHTFATTVALTNGLPIESVSKILGHLELKTTQLYAKVTDIKVSGDMQDLQQRLTATEQKKQLTALAS
ncbi:MAG: site-specific integrase [Mucilaginibacter sp.]|uniref:site-specific integrase n=1 Tax=Mucilaginibacter sp. TaxID=1882438 RepID=UPI003265C583